MNIAPAIPYFVYVSIALAIFLPRSAALYSSIFCAIVAAIVAPSHSAPFSTLFTVAICGLISLVISLVRNARSSTLTNGSWWVLLLIAYSTALSCVDLPTANDVSLRVLQGLVYLVGYFSCLAAGQMAIYSLGSALIFGMTLQAIFATGEVFQGALAPWPRADGTDVIATRVNSILPELTGRAMGSFAQPIPLGIFAAATGVVSFALYLVARRASYLYGACVSAFVLVLSGTRSAVLAMLVATAYILLRSFRMSRLPLYALVTIAILGFVIAIDLPSALGLGGIQSTASYTHRAATIMSIGEALSEPFGSVFFGHGYENVVGLFASGTIGGTDQITVPDNEYFRTFLGAGFVGFALLLGSVIRSLRHAAASSGALVVVVAISLFTFDGLGWNSVATLFYFALGAAAASSSRLAVRRSGGLVGSKSVDALIVTGDATQPSRRQGLC